MALSEIEKLERRYAENPQGLTFAPLAEIHRKNGEVQRALDLLGAGLSIHPDYIPASIVLGRCHMDLGNVQAAEAAFLHVLGLDGENVIALKALAEISERLLKFDDAERWLNTLLTVDRSNDDAREQLQRVEIARRQAGAASSAEPSSVAESGSEAATDQTPSAATVDSPVAEPADLEPSLLDEPFVEPAEIRFQEPAPPEPAGPAGIELETRGGIEADVPLLDEPVEPLEGLVGREVDSFVEHDEFRVETSEDIVLESAGGSEFQMPDASQELFASGARGARAPFEEDAPVGRSGAWEPPQAERAEPAEPRVPPPEEPAAEEPAAEELIAEELIGEELIVDELVVEEALPEARAPEQPAAQPFVYQPPPAAPEPGAAAPEPSEPPYVRRAEETRPPAAPPKRSYAVGETGGLSVAHLFKGILSARPPAQASAAPVRPAPASGNAGAPTRPAAEALSLSSVFGEEGSETPPAVPAANQGGGSVSFDDFFSSPSGSPASRTPRTPDPKTDDLDQFHAWLQNLKR